MTEEKHTEQIGLLDAEEIEAFIRHASEIEHPREMIIDVLRAIQKNHGWVPDEGVELAAKILSLTPLEVEELATFYDKIYRKPVGRFPIHICDSICCWSRGGEEIATYLEQKLGIALGQTSSDGLFTLLPSCCLGGCGRAPGVMVGQRFYGYMTVAEMDKLIDQLRREAHT